MPILYACIYVNNKLFVDAESKSSKDSAFTKFANWFTNRNVEQSQDDVSNVKTKSKYVTNCNFISQKITRKLIVKDNTDTYYFDIDDNVIIGIYSTHELPTKDAYAFIQNIYTYYNKKESQKEIILFMKKALKQYNDEPPKYNCQSDFDFNYCINRSHNNRVD